MVALLIDLMFLLVIFFGINSIKISIKSVMAFGIMLALLIFKRGSKLRRLGIRLGMIVGLLGLLGI